MKTGNIIVINLFDVEMGKKLALFEIIEAYSNKWFFIKCLKLVGQHYWLSENTYYSVNTAFYQTMLEAVLVSKFCYIYSSLNHYYTKEL